MFLCLYQKNSAIEGNRHRQHIHIYATVCAFEKVALEISLNEFESNFICLFGCLVFLEKCIICMYLLVFVCVSVCVCFILWLSIFGASNIEHIHEIRVCKKKLNVNANHFQVQWTYHKLYIEMILCFGLSIFFAYAPSFWFWPPMILAAVGCCCLFDGFVHAVKYCLESCV